ncbi:helix-turn-helix domain-containing protein [Paenibacillus sp. S150]|uniref:helix-turn-helix domain-containing protein n=1 Tax=Paenibacillus sp. S150 TaxID=2749826 RepID=UPI001C5A363C|nr:helix-turn-helix domain-containing protein [Paenibacillus sp. S150]MBW4082994.1 helix-turn-helix domain-containing protein [Paenibacillus sp. S150]
MTLFVRDLSKEEGNRLLRIARKGSNPVEVRRALLILASAQKMKVPEISQLYHISGEHIRKTIHRFNTEGMASLKPNYGGGRPPTFTEEQRADIIELAQIPPKVLGYPFTHWSLAKLKEAAEKKKIVPSISIETIRVILEEAKITYQNTKTWKESTDPEFESKKNESKPYTTVLRKTGG